MCPRTSPGVCCEKMQIYVMNRDHALEKFHLKPISDINNFGRGENSCHSRLLVLVMHKFLSDESYSHRSASVIRLSFWPKTNGYQSSSRGIAFWVADRRQLSASVLNHDEAILSRRSDVLWVGCTWFNCVYVFSINTLRSRLHASALSWR